MDPLINRDRRLYLKWGLEPSYALIKQLRVSARSSSSTRARERAMSSTNRS